jgi:hypothetical protein
MQGRVKEFDASDGLQSLSGETGDRFCDDEGLSEREEPHFASRSRIS